MPVYTYACTECGAAVEARQSFSDAPLTDCASCGGRLRRRYDAVGVSFNGSGFYRTDSRAAAKGASKGESKNAATKTSEGGSTSSGSSGTTTTTAKSGGSGSGT